MCYDRQPVLLSLSLLINTPKKEIWWWYSSSVVNCVETVVQMDQKGIHSCFPMKPHYKSVIHILCLTHTHTCRYVVPWPARLTWLYDWYSLSLFTTVLAFMYKRFMQIFTWHYNVGINLLGTCPSKPFSGGVGHLEGAEWGRVLSTWSLQIISGIQTYSCISIGIRVPSLQNCSSGPVTIHLNQVAGQFM